MNQTKAIVMAAGKGTRMKSSVPKILLKIKDKTMIGSVVSALSIPAIEEITLIVNPTTQDAIKEVLRDKVNYITQHEQKGTGHAVMCAEEWLKDFSGNVIIFVGDAPFITQEMVNQLIDSHNKNNNACTMFSAVFENEIPVYGRIIRDQSGKLVKIIEEKDATEEEKKIREVNSSHYCFDCRKLYTALTKTNDRNAQNEYYLSDVIEIFLNENEKVEAIPVEHPFFTYGINTLEELEERMLELKIFRDTHNA
ncbi:MAG: sugar phosphate nucleotidyltransferase [Candidatus Delongbacteria bacterium]|nr:sugar phosphate nucleotidyltransferase [Candidatus Delongbacteria bacterium]